MKKTHVKTKFTVPIYGVVIWIVVADDINGARRKMDPVFGADEDCPTMVGLCSHSGGETFGLFFKIGKHLTLRTVSHEVFHLTHRILEWTESRFDEQHHEQGALLYGFLITEVCRRMRSCWSGNAP